MRKLNKTTCLAWGVPWLLGILQIIFVALKLFNIIQWSWWLVLTPYFLEIVLCVVVATVLLCTDQHRKR